VRVAEALTRRRVAEIATLVDAPTANDVTVKLAKVALAGTVTVARTVAAEVFELASLTIRPPAGALAVRVTVPVEVAPPVRLAGLSETAEGTGALTVSVPVAVTPP
jgi:hypothetical protein